MSAARTIEELERPPHGYSRRLFNTIDPATERRTPALKIRGAGYVLNRLARNGYAWRPWSEFWANGASDATLEALARRGVIAVAAGEPGRVIRLTRKGAATLGRTDLTAQFDRLNRSRGQRPDYESNDVEGAAALARHAEL